MLRESPDNVVGVVTRLRAGQSGVRFPAEARHFCLLQWVPSVHSPVLKQPGREADH
jgi:hypothetical protein